MSSLVIGIPTLNRPHRIPVVSECAHASVSTERHEMRVCWLISPGDEDSFDAACDTGDDVIVADWQPTYADWARKLNLLYKRMDEEWLLLGADDLKFHPDWFDACIAASARHSSWGACVVGTNDLGNQRVIAGYHSTHPLVHRDYIHCGGVVDDPSKLLPEVYGHWFVDDEFVQTAQARRTYAHAFAAYVEHMHPEWGKAERDATYDHGYVSIPADHQIFVSRKKLWRPRP